MKPLLLYFFSMWDFHWYVYTQQSPLHVWVLLPLSGLRNLSSWVTNKSYLIPLFMVFFLLLSIIHGSLVHHPWTTCNPCTLIDGNLVRLYLWKPCVTLFFIDLTPLSILFVGFFPRSFVRALWAFFMGYIFVWAQSTHTLSLF